MKSAKVIFTYHVVHTQRTLSNVTTSVYFLLSLRLNTNALCQTDQISSSQTELFIMPGKTPEKFQAFPFSPKTQTVPLYLRRCRKARISPTWLKGKQILPGGEKAALANSSLLTSGAGEKKKKERRKKNAKNEEKFLHFLYRRRREGCEADRAQKAHELYGIVVDAGQKFAHRFAKKMLFSSCDPGDC